MLDSIARYLGIDLSTEGRAARNRRGVAMVVHGPPLSGKSRAAVALAKHYECALLTLDAIITDAIATSTSASAQKARQLCAEAAQKYAEEQRAIDAATAVDMARANAAAAGTGAASAAGNVAGANMAAATGGGLSAEALAQHTITRLDFFNLFLSRGFKHSLRKKKKLIFYYFKKLNNIYYHYILTYFLL